MVTVRHYKDLKALRNHEEGETAYVESDKCGYIYHDGKWHKVDASESGITMNLYELNKSLYSQMDALDDDSLECLKKDIDKGFKKKFYLLYGKEISYFSLFVREQFIIQDPENPQPSLGEAVIECLKSFEKVYSYEFKDNEQTVEIWVHNEETGLATVLYLFDYTDGVIYYE